MCQSCDSNVVLYSSEMSGVRHVSGVLFAMIVRWQVSDMCRSLVLYGSEMAGDRQVSGVLFSMVVRWQVPGMFQEICSLW